MMKSGFCDPVCQSTGMQSVEQAVGLGSRKVERLMA